MLLRGAAIGLASEVGGLIEGPLSADRAAFLFIRAQSEARATDDEPQPPRADFEEFMTWVWLCASVGMW